VCATDARVHLEHYKVEMPGIIFRESPACFIGGFSGSARQRFKQPQLNWLFFQTMLL